ncbi:heparan-alpha-glucosaminide N-acetyltransferase domain-containing protein [Herbiconiux sp. A18JL235]|uniref:Heparan-alpha-glucosaminide N-acetyltransferase domain-containing protein n=1 Tax=Herbiconiux sp. A18JL235 TaxID=3152363 RepID=A0AB39BJK4_9MICO
MPAHRILSLDVVRGGMLVVSVAVDSLLAQPEWFGHAVWEGVHPVDVVFPVFVTLSGCGLAFAMHRRVRAWPLLRRVAILLAAGLVYNAIALDSWSLDDWWLTGVLQLYAGVVAVLGLVHLITRTWWGWAIVTAAFATTHTVLLSAWASGCAGLVLTPDCNPSGVIDPAVFGVQHIYHQGALGHDPVGLVALLGALVSASAGATAGHLMLSPRLSDGGVGRSALPLIGLAAGAALAGFLTIWVPEMVAGVHPLAMKRLWTPPFALWVASGTSLALLAAHLAVDRRRVGRGVRAAVWPLVALGRNSLLVYFGSHALMSVLTRSSPSGGTPAAEIAAAIAVGGQPQLTFTLAMLAFWVALAALLHRLGVYLRP